MPDPETRWVARLTPAPSISAEDLLAMPLGLDVWEQNGEDLVIAATESTLAELECRRLARVERLATVEEFTARAEERARPKEEGRTE